ncbi:MAG: DUF3604 domain-containing protein, partial [Promethearchaeota archaeon]
MGSKSSLLGSMYKLREREWSSLWRIPRFLLYAFAVFTMFWYFWSVIGIIIGLSYFVFFKDWAWKRNGIILSFAIPSIDVFIFFYKEFAPLKLVIWSGVSFIVGYFIILLIVEFLKRKSLRTQCFKEQITKRIKNVPIIRKKLLLAFLIITPIGLWSSVNIDLGVMFDNNTRFLWINVPSKVNIGTNFTVTVEAWDSFERLSATYNGRIEFAVKSYNLTTYLPIISPVVTFPEPYSFTGQLFGSDIAYEINDGKDNGIHLFKMSIGTPGIHYILITDSLTKNIYYSNPIIVKDYKVNEQLIAWGDIHTHSQLSDGSGTAEHNFYFARQIARLDFFALTDHGEILLFNPGSLDFIESITNDNYEPGIFVTFHGIEWTQVETGHYVCIFSGDHMLKDPLLSYLTVPSINGLWNALDQFTAKTSDHALALPHHTTKRAYIQDWTLINPKYVKIAEVTSVHGEFLFEQRHELNYRGAIDPPPQYTYGSSITDAFKMGYRMTLYAASDVHDGHPGHSLSHTRAYIGHQRPWSLWHTRNEHPYPGGLTAVLTDNLTREGVFSALEQQQIFANSDHGRPILSFSINGIQVGKGSTLIVNNQTSPRLLNVFLAQDGAPVALKSEAASVNPNWSPNWDASIEILKNGDLWKTIHVSEPISNISILDTDNIMGTTFEPYCIKNNGNYYINSFSDNPIDPTT